MNVRLQPPPVAPAATTVSIADAVALALAQFQAGNRAEVEALCLKIMEVEPENLDALHLTGVLAHLAGKQGIALALIEKAARSNLANAQFQYNLGVVLGVLRRTDGALAAYRETARLEPAHASAWLNLGNALLEGDRLDDAIAAHQEHLQVKPHYPAATLALAIALYSARLRSRSVGGAFRCGWLAPMLRMLAFTRRSAVTQHAGDATLRRDASVASIR